MTETGKLTINRKSYWIVSSNRWNSAVTEYALSMAVALHEAGHKVLFSPLKDSPAESRAKQTTLPIAALRGFGLANLAEFWKAYFRSKPDHVFLLGGPETFLAKFIGAKKFRVWAEAAREPHLVGSIKGRISFSHLDGFIVPAQYLQAQLQQYTNKPVHHVTLGLDSQRFFRTETMGGFLQKRPQIIILGRLDPVKGHERALAYLAEAFKRWRDHQRRPCLHIIGEPANISQNQLLELIAKAGLKINEDVIISTGRLDNINTILSQAILGLIPSIGSELICRVGQEFLMCGTPVVVSGVGSLDEVLFAPDAGASYGALESNLEIATLIMNWVDKSLSEGEIAKRKRAQRAKEKFALSAMAIKIDEVMNLL